MDLSDLDPHCPEQRYRLYRRRADELVCVSACADEAHVVGMIRDQRDPEGGATLLPDDAVGLLDGRGDRDNPLDEYGNYTLPGSWLIKPWVPSETAPHGGFTSSEGFATFPSVTH